MRSFPSLPLLVVALACAPAIAQPAQHAVTTTASYLIAHPGELARHEGLDALKAGRTAEARRRFQRGARYADKLSGFFLAQLYWEGVGGAVDRPLAYAWMDLAAERGDRVALARREFFWNALDADERQQALAVGRRVYAEYADAVAQPRLETAMRRARKDVTGSRLGWVGKLDVCVAEEHKGMKRGLSDVCPPTMNGNSYYADALWQPRQYWAQQDAVMARELGSQVEVGPIQPTTPPGQRQD